MKNKHYRSDGWDNPEEREFTEPAMLGPKLFSCPSCHRLWKVPPKKSGNGRYWDYEGKCGDTNCGVSWVNRYHAYKKPSATTAGAEEANELEFDPSE